MFLVSLVPLVASVFHFRLYCRDPNLNGRWAKNSERKRDRQTEREFETYNIRKGGVKKNW